MTGNSKVRASARTTTQTTRMDGKRVKITTRNGKVTIKPALPQEWELQAAQCRRLRNMPEYGGQFLFAGDQNAAKRGGKARVQAQASGMIPGEPDMRVYGAGCRLLLWENKVGRGPVSASQKERHAALAALGHKVHVLRAVSEKEAADQAESLVRDWLLQPANDNKIG